jgi:hypothetical protein
MNLISPLSVSTVKLELFFNDIRLSEATGFFYKNQSRYFLISNWHVLTGRNVSSGQPIDKNGAIPNKLQFNIFSNTNQDTSNIISVFFYLNDTKSESIIVEHQLGRQVDIAMIELPLDFVSGKLALFCHYFDLDDINHDIIYEVGDNTYIIGYPEGISIHNVLPIWKGGTIASEPHLNTSGSESFFLVDTATRPGMSGSPVVFRSVNIHRRSYNNIIMNGKLEIKLIGVYSGRYGENNNNYLQLAKIWKSNLISEIIYHGRRFDVNKCL